jgi:hypothetical protein
VPSYTIKQWRAAVVATVEAWEEVGAARSMQRLDASGLPRVVALLDVDESVRLEEHGDEAYMAEVSAELVIMVRKDEDTARQDAFDLAHALAPRVHWNSWGLELMGAQQQDVARIRNELYGNAWEQAAITFTQRVRFSSVATPAVLPERDTYARATLGAESPAAGEPSDYDLLHKTSPEEDD